MKISSEENFMKKYVLTGQMSKKGFFPETSVSLSDRARLW